MAKFILELKQKAPTSCPWYTEMSFAIVCWILAPLIMPNAYNMWVHKCGGMSSGYNWDSFISRWAPQFVK